MNKSLKAVIYSEGRPIPVILEIPNNPFIGLSERSSICNSCGMIFYFPSMTAVITMEKTSIPLDLLFLDENFKVLSIIEKEPYSGQVESAGMYVIELNKGFSKRNNIREGDKVFLNKNCDNYLNIKPGIYKTNSGISIKIKGGGLGKYIDLMNEVKEYDSFDKLKKGKESFTLSDVDKELSDRYSNPDIEFKQEQTETNQKMKRKKFKLKGGGALYLLDDEGKPQMKLFTEERIFSRIDTRKILELVDNIDEKKNKEAVIKLGKKIVEIIKRQDTQPVEFVEE